ncbi:MAG TPA: hypothetical protein VNU49_09030 [Opitutaceae bacterium]|jgi:hypothetical protein|nr:hypothetical protein [Opitutaceae bacterium]
MTSDQALADLGNLFPEILAACNQAWLDLNTQSHPGWDRRCRSTVLQMSATVRFRERIARLGIQELSPDKRHLFLVPGKAYLFFKKASEALLPLNNHTIKSERFYSQEPLAGMDDLPRLMVGIRPNDDWTSLAGVYLIHLSSSLHRNWELSLATSESALEPDQLRFAPEPEIRQPVFKPRKLDVPRTDTDESRPAAGNDAPV